MKIASVVMLQLLLLIFVEKAVCQKNPKNCKEVKISDAKVKDETGGVFDIYVEAMGRNVEVYCDLVTDGGGWTVFQRRMDGSEDFYRDWKDYVRGFGETDKEFWLGLKNIRKMIKDGNYELRIDLEAFDGSKAYAKYDSFSISSAEDLYRLDIGAYSGTASDALTPHNNYFFTTKDQDNDAHGGNCAQEKKGAWWYYNCADSNLNGVYHDSVGYGYDGIWWWGWKNGYQYLKSTEMKFRPVQ